MGLFSQSDGTPLQTVIEAAGLTSAAFFDELLGIADQVSELLLGFYARPDDLAASQKSDSSPITAADHGAHALLQQALGRLTPQVPILSEESPAEAISNRRQWQALWVVDPLDGTREFIERTDEFTCNIALVIDGRPVLGLISVPVAGHHYLGVPGAGAMRFTLGQRVVGEPLRTRLLDPTRPLGLLASQRHHPERVAAMTDALSSLAAGVTRHNAGSAVKFCALLEGEADVYPRSSPCYEWDVAAGDALVTAAGGSVRDVNGEPLSYNSQESLLADRFVAAADPAVDYSAALLAVAGLSTSRPRS